MRTPARCALPPERLGEPIVAHATHTLALREPNQECRQAMAGCSGGVDIVAAGIPAAIRIDTQSRVRPLPSRAENSIMRVRQVVCMSLLLILLDPCRSLAGVAIPSEGGDSCERANS